MLIVAAAALIDAEGRVLVQERPRDKPMGGLWEFPGGKLEPGEAPVAALVRELREELGIEVRPESLEPLAFATGPHGSLLLLLFVGRRWTGEPVPHAAERIAWRDLAELDPQVMPPADGPLLAALRFHVAAHGSRHCSGLTDRDAR